MAETTGTARKTAAAKRSTAAKKTAGTRPAAKRTTSAKTAAAAPVAPKTPVDRVQEYAERAALVQLGAALVARDVVTEAVGTLRGTLSSREQAEKELQVRRKRLEAELKRFEHRGTTARTGIERDLKARRGDLVKQTKGLTSRADVVTARVETLLQTGVTAGQKAATTVTERVAAVL